MSIGFTEDQFSWRGIHHIALATGDIEETARFYGDILGMHVGAIALSKQGRGRHCIIFAKLNDSDTWGFHFFERPEVAKKAMDLSGANHGSNMLHIALRLLDDAAANALRERLRNAEVLITEIPELGSFLFNDNNGILLEVTWPKDDA